MLISYGTLNVLLRALQQNKDLKEQLAQIETRFIEMVSQTLKIFFAKENVMEEDIVETRFLFKILQTLWPIIR